ncbi:unnamed protein product [Owenia fusiformis]|uniref:UDP-glucuronosyltransferase n=1 Tax=Owenia fusiformis TaxID=6347 RepID=A0A8J1T5N2_OWEFU|nr:unnamed protein product [Owenia fusiformis]
MRLVLIVILCLVPAESGKIAVFPYGQGFNSRLMNMEKIIGMLADDGHSVTMIISSVYDETTRPLHNTAKVMKYPAPVNTLLITDKEFLDQINKASSELEMPQIFIKTQVNFCESLLKNGLMEKLKMENFELLILDYADYCSRFLNDYLDIPTIVYSNFGPISEGEIGFPSTTSYIPTFMVGFQDTMTFWERLQNLLSYSAYEFIGRELFMKEFRKLRQKYDYNRTLSLWDSHKRAALYMSHANHALDFPRPLMPNHIYVGGMFFSPKKYIKPSLQKIIYDSAPHGVILMSFGTLLSHMAIEKAEIFAKVFAQLPHTVIWKYEGITPENLANNTILMKWLPQNDILGNTRTKLFISHCGISSLYEAVNHAVPTLGIPFMFDQDTNAAKIITRYNIGLVVKFKTITEESIYNAIKAMLENKVYKDNAVELSKMAKDTPVTPKATFLYWVNFVLRHKGPGHLRSKPAYEMSWIQYFSLDVIAFVLTVCLIICTIVAFILRCICKCICRSKTKLKKH